VYGPVNAQTSSEYHLLYILLLETELPVGQISVVTMDDAQNKPEDLEHRNKGVITVRALRV
jgi:hypothetical protein